MTKGRIDRQRAGDIAEWLTCLVLSDAGWHCRRVEGFPYDVIARYSPTGQYLLQVKAAWMYGSQSGRAGYSYEYRYPTIRSCMAGGSWRRYERGAFDFFVAVMWDRANVFATEPVLWMIPQSVIGTRVRVRLSKNWDRFKMTRAMLRSRCEF